MAVTIELYMNILSHVSSPSVLRFEEEEVLEEFLVNSIVPPEMAGVAMVL